MTPGTPSFVSPTAPPTPAGRVAAFYAEPAQRDAWLARHPSWHNLAGIEREAQAHPEWVDFRNPQSPLHAVKAVSTEIYRRFFGGACERAAGSVVLDAGCGVGRFWPWLCSWAREVYAFDASLAQLRTALSHLSPDERARLRVACADLDCLAALPAGAVDVVWSTELLCYVDDPAAALAELARVTRVGGLLCLSVEGQWAAAAVREGLAFEALRREGPAVVTVPGDYHLHLFDGAALVALCRAQNLEIVKTGASHFFVEGALWRSVDDERLADSAYRERVLAAEAELSADPRAADWGRCLMVVCRKPRE